MTIVDYIIPSRVFNYSLDDFLMPGKTDYHPEYDSLLYPQAMLDHLDSESLT
jgi:hypothetical protein